MKVSILIVSDKTQYLIINKYLISSMGNIVGFNSPHRIFKKTEVI